MLTEIFDKYGYDDPIEELRKEFLERLPHLTAAEIRDYDRLIEAWNRRPIALILHEVFAQHDQLWGQTPEKSVAQFRFEMFPPFRAVRQPDFPSEHFNVSQSMDAPEHQQFADSGYVAPQLNAAFWEQRDQKAREAEKDESQHFEKVAHTGSPVKDAAYWQQRAKEAREAEKDKLQRAKEAREAEKDRSPHFEKVAHTGLPVKDAAYWQQRAKEAREAEKDRPRPVRERSWDRFPS